MNSKAVHDECLYLQKEIKEAKKLLAIGYRKVQTLKLNSSMKEMMMLFQL